MTLLKSVDETSATTFTVAPETWVDTTSEPSSKGSSLANSCGTVAPGGALRQLAKLGGCVVVVTDADDPADVLAGESDEQAASTSTALRPTLPTIFFVVDMFTCAAW